MVTKRIIPCLDVRDGRVVKGVNFGNIGDVASPVDMAALYSGAAAFVFPSLYEGFGMPPLEAMACGCPVLCADAASLPEAASGAALLCDPYHSRAIAAGLRQILSETEQQRLRGLGLARAAEMSWAHAAEKLYAVYQELAI